MSLRTNALVWALLAGVTLTPACEEAAPSRVCQEPIDLDTASENDSSNPESDSDIAVDADPDVPANDLLAPGYCPSGMDDPNDPVYSPPAEVGGLLIPTDDNRDFSFLPGEVISERAVITSQSHNSLEVTFSNRTNAVIEIRWPELPSEIDLDLPALGQEVMATYACSPAATFCFGPASHLVLEDLAGKLLFEGGQLAALEYLAPELSGSIRMQLDYRPSAPSCGFNLLTVIPISMLLTRPVTWIGSGEQVTIEVDGQQFFIWVIRAYNTEAPAPPDDIIHDWGVAFMAPIKR